MKPIHIMRWAPADYVNDPSVKLALAQRDFVSATFWPLFLFHAFIQGGELPADIRLLAATVGMTTNKAAKALAFWKARGNIKELNGKLYQVAIRVSTDERRPHIPKMVRREVYERDGRACLYCGSTEDLSLDHVVPYSRGGPDLPENLQVLCMPCNVQKADS